MISGKILYGASDILATAVKDGTTACEEVDVCGKKKRFCLKGESFSSKVSTYSELKTHLDNKSQNANPKYTVYPTFFCTKPDKEPSCVPERKRSADVPNLPASQGNDKDGDGVEDEKDVFPEDATEWEDANGDGLGDNKEPLSSFESAQQEPVVPLLGFAVVIGIMIMLYRAQPPGGFEKKEFLETNLEEE